MMRLDEACRQERIRYTHTAPYVRRRRAEEGRRAAAEWGWGDYALGPLHDSDGLFLD